MIIVCEIILNIKKIPDASIPDIRCKTFQDNILKILPTEIGFKFKGKC